MKNITDPRTKKDTKETGRNQNPNNRRADDRFKETPVREERENREAAEQRDRNVELRRDDRENNEPRDSRDSEVRTETGEPRNRRDTEVRTETRERKNRQEPKTNKKQIREEQTS